jgi:predicted dehydrogenase
MDESNKYARTEWRIKHKYEGGFITDGGVHNIAGIRFLAGEIVKYQAMARQINPSIGEMDTFSMQFATDQGISGTLNLFQSSNGYFENKVLMLGTEGALKLEDGFLSLHHRDQIVEKIHFEEDNGYMEEFEDFYQAIRTGSRPVSDFEQGYRDLEVILGAIDHAKNW